MLTGNPTLVTSIPPIKGGEADPRLYDEIKRNITSFKENGFDVVSVLRKGEQADPFLSSGVTFANSDGSGFFEGRYGPAFSDILSGKNGRIGAVVNSDIYMPASNIIDACKNVSNTVFVSRRINVSKLGGDFEGILLDGIDGIFFSPDVDTGRIGLSALGQFQLGVPFWDIVIPLAFSFHYDVIFTSPPLLVHPTHPAGWNLDDYRLMRSRAVAALEHYATQLAPDNQRAQLFIDGMASYQGSFSNRSKYHDEKRGAEYIAHRLRIMETENCADIIVDFNDIYLRSAITSFLSTDSSAFELIRNFSADGLEPGARRFSSLDMLRTLLEARRILKRRMRRNRTLSIISGT